MNAAPTLPPDFRRLQEIEEHVIAAVAAAAAVAGELANLGPQLDRQAVKQQCEHFMQQVNLAQDLVQQAVELPTSEREFKAHVYHSMLKAHVAQEKVMVVERLLQGMMDATQQRYEQLPESGGTARSPADGMVDR